MAQIMQRIIQPEGEVKIAVVGNIRGCLTAYKSLQGGAGHGGIANNVKVNLEWIESEIFEKEYPAPWLEEVNAYWCRAVFRPNGVGRKNQGGEFRPPSQVPYFGHLFRDAEACIEAARNLCGIAQARRPSSARRRNRSSAPYRVDEGQRA